MKPILYSNHCPCCVVLRAKLDAAGIDYDVESDLDKMLALNMTHLPMLWVDDRLLTYPAALMWLHERTNHHAN